MTLNFSENEDGQYEASFQADSCFVIHIERSAPSNIRVLQTSVEDAQYAPMNEFPNGYSNLKVLDIVVMNPVTLWIKIIASEEPDLCIITFES